MKRILIIEDNQGLANLYRGMLGMAGFTVVVSHDGEKGLSEAVEALRSCLVLSR